MQDRSMKTLEGTDNTRVTVSTVTRRDILSPSLSEECSKLQNTSWCKQLHQVSRKQTEEPRHYTTRFKVQKEWHPCLGGISEHISKNKILMHFKLTNKQTGPANKQRMKQPNTNSAAWCRQRCSQFYIRETTCFYRRGGLNTEEPALQAMTQLYTYI